MDKLITNGLSLGLDQKLRNDLIDNFKKIQNGVDGQSDALNKQIKDMLGDVPLQDQNEVTQARIDANGYPHETLKSRLDETQNTAETALDDSNLANNKVNRAINMAELAISGSPKGGFETLDDLKNSFPNGDNAIYVIEDTGHWYYWSDGWEDGGLYQAPEIADKSVTNEKLSNDIKYNALNTTGGKVILGWSDGYVTSKGKQATDGTPEGTIMTNPNFSITQPILVHSGDLLIVNGYMGSAGVLVALFNVDGEYVKSLKDGISTNDQAVIVVPQSGYVRISNFDKNFELDKVTVERRPYLTAYSLDGWTAGEISWHSVPLVWTPHSYVGADDNSKYPNMIGNNNLINEIFSSSKAIPVNAGTLVNVTAGIASSAWLLAEFDRTGTVFKQGVLKGNGQGGTHTVYIDHSTYLKVSNNINIVANPKVATQRTSSELAGKSINVIGDSYVENNTDVIENTWHYKMAQKYGMTYSNYGHNGNGLITPNKNGTPVVERYEDMTDVADYVVVIGGKNDYNDQYPLDDFKAGVVTLIKGLVEKYPTAKICFFTPWSLGDSEKQEIKLIDYAQAIEDTCNVFGIACFNSYKHSNITPWDTAFRKKYMQTDNDISHLNSTGHNRFLPQAEAFLESM